MDSGRCMKILRAVQIAMIRFVGETGWTPYDSMEKLKIQFYPGDLYHIWETGMGQVAFMFLSLTHF